MKDPRNAGHTGSVLRFVLRFLNCCSVVAVVCLATGLIHLSYDVPSPWPVRSSGYYKSLRKKDTLVPFSLQGHDEWPYTCYTPKKGLSRPEVTIITSLAGAPVFYWRFLRDNRLRYASLHGYRYCEFRHNTSIDDTHHAFKRYPFILAVAPCTRFVVNLDYNVIVKKSDMPLKQWLDYMDKKSLVQLFAAGSSSPINLSMFIIKSGPWMWHFFQMVYNRCACDWERTHGHHADAHMVHDVLAEQPNSFAASHTNFVSSTRFLHVLGPNQSPADNDTIVEVSSSTMYPATSGCRLLSKATEHCKFVGLTEFIRGTIIQGKKLADPVPLFDIANNTCQKVHISTLVSMNDSYFRLFGNTFEGSALDFDIHPSDDQVLGVKLSTIACLRFHVSKCSLPYYWDAKQSHSNLTRPPTHLD